MFEHLANEEFGATGHSSSGHLRIKHIIFWLIQFIPLLRHDKWLQFFDLFDYDLALLKCKDFHKGLYLF